MWTCGQPTHFRFSHVDAAFADSDTPGRFGEKLQSSLIKDWYFHYVSYDKLKKRLKSDAESDEEPAAGEEREADGQSQSQTPSQTKDGTADGNEAVPSLKRKKEAKLGTVKHKQQPWTDEDEAAFVGQLEDDLERVYSFQNFKSGEIVRRIEDAQREVDRLVASADIQARQQPRSGQADAEVEEEFLLLEELLSDLIADVHDLAKFTQLNYTGFQKIIKKHDVSSSGAINAPILPFLSRDRLTCLNALPQLRNLHVGN